ncbi:hypothetical protein CYMTET_47845 [Cymbomonas tetramitiformis]|uniref:Uncharacterized protein n=1 Tax=Cymbomonas tetramitiformis TaxID=36881 RepID=A0AAE0BUY0_9CHLO|nr:hypothetical protein CYMTET_47845 [Cymbomonas tetramitiformis]
MSSKPSPFAEDAHLVKTKKKPTQLKPSNTTSAKQARKEADDKVRQMTARIAYLKAEEIKATKNIAVIKQRTAEALQVKQAESGGEGKGRSRARPKAAKVGSQARQERTNTKICGQHSTPGSSTSTMGGNCVESALSLEEQDEPWVDVIGEVGWGAPMRHEDLVTHARPEDFVGGQEHKHENDYPVVVFEYGAGAWEKL